MKFNITKTSGSFAEDTIEINTLEELLAFSEKWYNDIILIQPIAKHCKALGLRETPDMKNWTIELYNTNRE